MYIPLLLTMTETCDLCGKDFKKLSAHRPHCLVKQSAPKVVNINGQSTLLYQSETYKNLSPSKQPFKQKGPCAIKAGKNGPTILF